MAITRTGASSSSYRETSPPLENIALKRRKIASSIEVQPATEQSGTSFTQPFDEFNVSDEKIDELREDIKKQGFCRIKFSDVTLKLFSDKIEENKLDEQVNLISNETEINKSTGKFKILKMLKSYFYKSKPEPEPEPKPNSENDKSYSKFEKNIDLSMYVKNLNSLHHKLSETNHLQLKFFKIQQGNMREEPQNWHYDGGIVTCLATLEGKPTEYVSLEDDKNKFKQHSYEYSSRRILKEGYEEKNINIHKMEKGYCYFHIGYYQGDYLSKKNHLPRLLHRAPENMDERRAIFVGFWY